MQLLRKYLLIFSIKSSFIVFIIVFILINYIRISYYENEVKI